jgi:hypothetical protein
VQVVQDQQQRLGVPGPPEQPGDGVEQAEAGLVGLQGRARGELPDAPGEPRHQPGHLGGAVAQLPAQHRRVAPRGVLAQRLDPRPEGGRAVALPAGPPEHAGTERPRAGGQLVGQAGLADARLAGHQHERPVAGRRLAERLRQLVKVALAADEGPGPLAGGRAGTSHGAIVPGVHGAGKRPPTAPRWRA